MKGSIPQPLHCIVTFPLVIRHKAVQWTSGRGGDLDSGLCGTMAATNMSTAWTITGHLAAEPAASRASLDGLEAALPDR